MIVLIVLIAAILLLGSSGVGFVIISALLIMAPWSVKIIIILGLTPFFLLFLWIIYDTIRTIRNNQQMIKGK